MMNLGELREHPAFPNLARELQIQLDSARDRVLRAAKEDTLAEIRYLVGQHDCIAEQLRQLRRTKEK